MEHQLQIWSKQLPGWAWNLCLIAAALLIGGVIKLLLTWLLHYYKNTKDYSVFRSILTHLNRPLNHFIPLLTVNALLPFLILEGVYMTNFRKLIGIFLVISFSSLLINAINIFQDFVYFKYDLNKENNLEERKIQTQLRFVRKLITALIVVVAIAVILLSFDNVRKLGAGLLTGVGIGSVIIGFAAQKSLGNLLAGLQIAFTQPIRIDDVLVVEGEWGRVEDITLTYVVVNIWDQRRLILPINYFIEKPFQNWTRTTAELLGTVEIYVDYNCIVDDVRNELTRVLNTSELWDKRVNVLQVWEATQTTMQIRAIVSAKNASNLVDLRCYVRESLIRFIQQRNGNSLPKLRIENTVA